MAPKQCKVCLVSKPLNDFTKYSTCPLKYPDGRVDRCKQCVKVRRGCCKTCQTCQELKPATEFQAQQSVQCNSCRQRVCEICHEIKPHIDFLKNSYTTCKHCYVSKSNHLKRFQRHITNDELSNFNGVSEWV